MFWTLLAPLITKLIPVAGDYLTRKQQAEINKADAKLALDKAKVEAQIEMIKAETKRTTDADIESIKAQRDSIKDEILMVILLAPFVAAFIPNLQGYVKEGFNILNGLPMWYQVSIIGLVITVFGLRFMFDRFFKK